MLTKLTGTFASVPVKAIISVVGVEPAGTSPRMYEMVQEVHRRNCLRSLVESLTSVTSR